MASKKKAPRNTLVAILVLFLVLAGVWYYNTSKTSRDTSAVVQEDLAQLSSTDEYMGNAMATRSQLNRETVINVTAFLTNTSEGESYGVWLMNEDDSVYLGELTLAGDVYSLNYKTEREYEGYDELTITLLEGEDEMGETILTGSFVE